MHKTRICSLSALILLACSYLCAQSTQGTITGTITDSQGARVPGVEVVARHVATNLDYHGKSSDDGTYVIPGLPVGRFEVTATAPSFKTFRRTDVVLEVAERLKLDIGLELGQLTETVTVQGEVTHVTTEGSTLGTVVERRRIEKLRSTDATSSTWSSWWRGCSRLTAPWMVSARSPTRASRRSTSTGARFTPTNSSSTAV